MKARALLTAAIVAALLCLAPAALAGPDYDEQAYLQGCRQSLMALDFSQLFPDQSQAVEGVCACASADLQTKLSPQQYNDAVKGWARGRHGSAFMHFEQGEASADVKKFFSMAVVTCLARQAGNK